MSTIKNLHELLRKYFRAVGMRYAEILAHLRRGIFGKMHDYDASTYAETARNGLSVLNALRSFSEEQQKLFSMKVLENWARYLSKDDLQEFSRLPPDQRLVILRTGLQNLNDLLQNCADSGNYVIGVNRIGKITVSSSDDIFSEDGRPL